MLEVKNFSKKYKGATKYSAQNISFTLPDGKILGLLGKNGAGKSTTIKSICGIFPFDEGQIIVNGFDIRKKSVKAKQTIGYTPDDHSIYERLTGRECLNYIGSLYGVKKQEKIRIIEQLSRKFDIAYAIDKPISSYSHGMKQKICLCASLMHQPKLWILDEPMLGLDPQTKKTVMDFIKEYAAKRNSVLFSSHDIYTVSQICDYVVIIDNGVILDRIDMTKSKFKNPLLLEKHFMNLTTKAK